MYEILVTKEMRDAALNPAVLGRQVLVTVKVDWPELRLTEEQILANAIAHADGRHGPFPDRSFITLVFER